MSTRLSIRRSESSVLLFCATFLKILVEQLFISFVIYLLSAYLTIFIYQIPICWSNRPAPCLIDFIVQLIFKTNFMYFQTQERDCVWIFIAKCKHKYGQSSFQIKTFFRWFPIAPRLITLGASLMGLHLLLQFSLLPPPTVSHRPSELCPFSLDLGWSDSYLSPCLLESLLVFLDSAPPGSARSLELLLTLCPTPRRWPHLLVRALLTTVVC